MFPRMGRMAIQPSRALGGFLREQRLRMGWTLRDVEGRTRKLGRPIPFATLAKVEQGRVDPGLRRLHILLKLYDLPAGLAQEVIDLEEFAGVVPEPADAPTAYRDAVADWKSGDLRRGFARLASLRALSADQETTRREHQRSILALAVAVGSLGRYRLSRYLVDELLLAQPEREILVPCLVQAAVCWHWLGSCEVALGFLSRADANTGVTEHLQGAWIAHERASTLASMDRFDEADASLTDAIAGYHAAGEAFGESQARGVRVRIRLRRNEFAAARDAAREAREHALQHGFGRLVVLRSLDEGQALLELAEPEAACARLDDALASAIFSRDDVARFYAHHHRWKAFERLGNREQAEEELTAARQFVESLDAAVPEVAEVRAATTRP